MTDSDGTLQTNIDLNTGLASTLSSTAALVEDDTSSLTDFVTLTDNVATQYNTMMESFDCSSLQTPYHNFYTAMC